MYRDIYKDDVKTLEELEKAEKLNTDLPSIYNLKGLVCQGRHDYKTATDLYQKAIDLCKDEVSPIFYYNQSVAYYNLKDYDSAKSASESVLKLYKNKVENQPDVLQTMGLIYIMKQEFSYALPYFEQGLQLEPENYDMLHGYSIALREVGQTDKAIVMHRRAIRLWPGYVNGYVEFIKTLEQAGKWEKEAEIYKKLVELFRSNEFLNAWNHEDTIKLMQIFDNSLTKQEANKECQSVFACVFGSILYFVVKDLISSVKYFDVAFPDKDPETDIKYLTRTDYLHTFGLTLAKYALTLQEENVKYLEKALDRLQQASILYDEQQIYTLAKCFNDLANVYKELFEFELADKSYINSAKYFRKLNLNIQASDEHVKSAECLMEWSRYLNNFKYYKDAREECNNALSIDSTNYNAFHIKGLNFYHLYLYKDAIPQFEKATEINFNLLGAQYNLGLCYRYLENYEMASTKFKTIIRLEKNKEGLEPDYILDPYEQLIICNGKLDKLDESEKFLREAAELYPNSVRCLLLFGDVLVKQKLYKQAAGNFESAIDQDPDNLQNLRHKALNSLSDLYAEQGIMIDKAYNMSREALSICKSNDKITNSEKEYLAKIRSTLGWIFFQKGSYSKAVLFLENSIIHQLDDTRTYAHLAMAYQKLADQYTDKQKLICTEKAIMLWDQVLKLDTRKKWVDRATKQKELLSSD